MHRGGADENRGPTCKGDVPGRKEGCGKIRTKEIIDRGGEGESSQV
jgi:hypothetical protein